MTANIRTVRKDKTEYHAVQLAASDRPDRTTTKSMIGHFKQAGVPSKYIVKEFPVTPDAHVPIGEFILNTLIVLPNYLPGLRNYTVFRPLCTWSICGCGCKLVGQI